MSEEGHMFAHNVQGHLPHDMGYTLMYNLYMNSKLPIVVKFVAVGLKGSLN